MKTTPRQLLKDNAALTIAGGIGWFMGNLWPVIRPFLCKLFCP